MGPFKASEGLGIVHGGMRDMVTWVRVRLPYVDEGTTRYDADGCGIRHR